MEAFYILMDMLRIPVSKIIGLKHKVVNHSCGYVANDEPHTNNIEGF
jgi:hypothetical protein